MLVLPGTYVETLTITKGLTLAAIGGKSGEVIISPAGTPASVIEIATTQPVTLRGLTVHVPGCRGDSRRWPGGRHHRKFCRSIAPTPVAAAQSNLVSVGNDLLDGSRARLVVRDSVIDGRMTIAPVGQSFLVRAHGDIDALIERNVLRRAGGACIFVVTRADLGGETNADILDNDLDECHPVGRVAAVLVGPVAVNQPSATRPLTATGTVNIVGNTIRNSLGFCLNSAIAYEVYSGRIEHNVVAGFVQPCVVPPNPRNRPSAIWIGRLSAFPFPASDADGPLQRSPGQCAGKPSRSRRIRRSRSTRPAITGGRNPDRRASGQVTDRRSLSIPAEPCPSSCPSLSRRLPEPGQQVVDRVPHLGAGFRRAGRHRRAVHQG